MKKLTFDPRDFYLKDGFDIGLFLKAIKMNDPSFNELNFKISPVLNNAELHTIEWQ